mmetsp:Transcript_24148/g.36571  ORF Transcript_24148/g.36571 Transcript_24148/m.36571 type:complete len:91 (+) Transcript_24148:113-385(+)
MLDLITIMGVVGVQQEMKEGNAEQQVSMVINESNGSAGSDLMNEAVETVESALAAVDGVMSQGFAALFGSGSSGSGEMPVAKGKKVPKVV